MQNELTVYEVGFHINPSLPEGEILGKVTDLKQEISTRGGVFISEEFPSLFQLAYTITKRIGNDNKRFTQTFFGWIKFEMSPASIVEFKKVIESDIDMIRFLIIKTVREDTMISTRPEFKLALGEDEESGDDAKKERRAPKTETKTQKDEESDTNDTDDADDDSETNDSESDKESESNEEK